VETEDRGNRDTLGTIQWVTNPNAAATNDGIYTATITPAGEGNTFYGTLSLMVKQKEEGNEKYAKVSSVDVAASKQHYMMVRDGEYTGTCDDNDAAAVNNVAEIWFSNDGLSPNPDTCMYIGKFDRSNIELWTHNDYEIDPLTAYIYEGRSYSMWPFPYFESQKESEGDDSVCENMVQSCRWFHKKWIVALDENNGIKPAGIPSNEGDIIVRSGLFDVFRDICVYDPKCGANIYSGKKNIQTYTFLAIQDVRPTYSDENLATFCKSGTVC